VGSAASAACLAVLGRDTSSRLGGTLTLAPPLMQSIRGDAAVPVLQRFAGFALALLLASSSPAEDDRGRDTSWTGALCACLGSPCAPDVGTSEGAAVTGRGAREALASLMRPLWGLIPDRRRGGTFSLCTWRGRWASTRRADRAEGPPRMGSSPPRMSSLSLKSLA
jgi:hypothetical protein